MWWIWVVVVSFVVGIVTSSYNIEYREVILIAGNFSLKGGLCNLAQYDISTGLYGVFATVCTSCFAGGRVVASRISSSMANRTVWCGI